MKIPTYHLNIILFISARIKEYLQLELTRWEGGDVPVVSGPPHEAISDQPSHQTQLVSLLDQETELLLTGQHSRPLRLHHHLHQSPARLQRLLHHLTASDVPGPSPTSAVDFNLRGFSWYFNPNVKEKVSVVTSGGFRLSVLSEL